MTSADLPEPLTPPDCDLRDAPVPRDMLVELVVSTFGVTAEEAMELIDAFEPFFPGSISPVGRA